VVFSGASLLLAVFFGAALGNVVRGVPLDDTGYFFAPLWTDFTATGPRVGVLDWYTVIVGVTALLALVNHGSLWVAGKTDGEVNARARNVVLKLWAPLVVMVVVNTVATFRIQPHVPERMVGEPWLLLFPLLAIAGLAGMIVYTARNDVRTGFVSSCLFLAGMLLSVVLGLYPNVLPSIADPAASLTIHNAAADAYALRVALVWWIPGMLLTGAYTVFAYRRFAGKVSLERGGY
jgi:cytochrome d ubiquinol oxidase subunit II